MNKAKINNQETCNTVGAEIHWTRVRLSSPPPYARLIQLIECHSYKVEVVGLSPSPSTIIPGRLTVGQMVLVHLIEVRILAGKPFIKSQCRDHLLE